MAEGKANRIYSFDLMRVLAFSCIIPFHLLVELDRVGAFHIYYLNILDREGR